MKEETFITVSYATFKVIQFSSPADHMLSFYSLCCHGALALDISPQKTKLVDSGGYGRSPKYLPKVMEIILIYLQRNCRTHLDFFLKRSG